MENNNPTEKTFQEPYGRKDYKVYEESDLEHVEDYSDDEGVKDPKQPREDLYQRKKTSKGFYNQFRRYLRNPETKFYTILNGLLTAIAFALLLVVIGLIVYCSVVFNNHNRLSNETVKTRCLFEWEPWSECSQPCRVAGKILPNKTRMVNVTSIVQAAEGFVQCPEDLEKLVDIAPCNTHYCPVGLSSLPWDEDNCFAVSENLCFMPRKGLDGNTLVELDVPDVFKKCECRPGMTEFAKFPSKP